MELVTDEKIRLKVLRFKKNLGAIGFEIGE